MSTGPNTREEVEKHWGIRTKAIELKSQQKGGDRNA